MLIERGYVSFEACHICLADHLKSGPQCSDSLFRIRASVSGSPVKRNPRLRRLRRCEL
jgi:hypothetical protein